MLLLLDSAKSVHRRVLFSLNLRSKLRVGLGEGITVILGRVKHVLKVLSLRVRTCIRACSHVSNAGSTLLGELDSRSNALVLAQT